MGVGDVGVVRWVVVASLGDGRAGVEATTV